MRLVGQAVPNVTCSRRMPSRSGSPGCGEEAGSGRASGGPAARVIAAPPSTRPMIASWASFLSRLDQARRQEAAGLDIVEQVVDRFASRHGAGQGIGGGNRVLDGEIDADAADRGHGVGSHADGERFRAVPAIQPTERDGSKGRSSGEFSAFGRKVRSGKASATSPAIHSMPRDLTASEPPLGTRKATCQ